MKYVSSLISGVGIFCVGTGLSVYHGITGLLHPEPMQDFFYAFFILAGSFVSEGGTLMVAINEVRRSAKLQGISFRDYGKLFSRTFIYIKSVRKKTHSVRISKWKSHIS